MARSLRTTENRTLTSSEVMAEVGSSMRRTLQLDETARMISTICCWETLSSPIRLPEEIWIPMLSSCFWASSAISLRRMNPDLPRSSRPRKIFLINRQRGNIVEFLMDHLDAEVDGIF